MEREQLFRPDTCECVLMQVYEDSTTPWTFVRGEVVERGPEHPTQTYEQIIEENRIKNYVIDALLRALAAANIDPSSIAWRFGADRTLFITAPFVITNQQRNAVRNEILRIFRLDGVKIADTAINKVVIENPT